MVQHDPKDFLRRTGDVSHVGSGWRVRDFQSIKRRRNRICKHTGVPFFQQHAMQHNTWIASPPAFQRDTKAFLQSKQIKALREGMTHQHRHTGRSASHDAVYHGKISDDTLARDESAHRPADRARHRTTPNQQRWATLELLKLQDRKPWADTWDDELLGDDAAPQSSSLPDVDDSVADDHVDLDRNGSVHLGDTADQAISSNGHLAGSVDLQTFYLPKHPMDAVTEPPHAALATSSPSFSNFSYLAANSSVNLPPERSENPAGSGAAQVLFNGGVGFPVSHCGDWLGFDALQAQLTEAETALQIWMRQCELLQDQNRALQLQLFSNTGAGETQDGFVVGTGLHGQELGIHSSNDDDLLLRIQVIERQLEKTAAVQSDSIVRWDSFDGRLRKLASSLGTVVQESVERRFDARSEEFVTRDEISAFLTADGLQQALLAHAATVGDQLAANTADTVCRNGEAILDYVKAQIAALRRESAGLANGGVLEARLSDYISQLQLDMVSKSDFEAIVQSFSQAKADDEKALSQVWETLHMLRTEVMSLMRNNVTAPSSSSTVSGTSEAKGASVDKGRPNMRSLGSVGQLPAKLRVGDIVSTHSLQSSAMNGQMGVITGYNKTKQRYSVRISASDGSLEEKLFKACNLQADAEMSGWSDTLAQVDREIDEFSCSSSMLF